MMNILISCIRTFVMPWSIQPQVIYVLERMLILIWLLLVGCVQAQTCTQDTISFHTPDSQLQDNGDGTITDTKTGLMWKQCSEGQSGSNCSLGSVDTLNWQGALQRVDIVNNNGFAGYHDWRLPNIKELNTIVEWGCVQPAINLNRFPNTPLRWYWSSSLVVDGGIADAWFILFDSGVTSSGWGAGYYFNAIRLVRNGN